MIRLIALLCLGAALPAGANLLVADGDWLSRAFSGETEYTWRTDAGGEYVCGNAAATASMRIREVRVDLDATPVLRWRWRTSSVLPGLPQRTRAGDDFPVRVYVASRTGLRVRTLAFVWAHAAATAPWPNPFDANTVVIPLRHGDAPGWHTESVDVRRSLRTHFGIDAPGQLGIGFMTDGDNSGRTLSGCYRDLEFLPADAL